MTSVGAVEHQTAPARLPSSDEALRIVTSEATCSVPAAAVVLGTSERLVREAIQHGEVAAIRLGRNIRVLCAPLRRQLGIEA